SRLRREIRLVLQQANQRLNSIREQDLFRRPMGRINALRQLLDDRQRTLWMAMLHRVHAWRGRVHALSLKVDQCRPASVIRRLRERVTEKEKQLNRAMGQRVNEEHAHLAKAVARLRELHPRHAIQLNRQRLENLAARLRKTFECSALLSRQRVSGLEA